MGQFKRIVVPASVGQIDVPTLKAAVAFAAASGATLTLLDVFEPLPSWRRKVNVEGRVIDVQELMLEDRKGQLEELLAHAGGHAEVATDATTGKPFVEVIRYVAMNQCDLVIVGEPVSPKGVRPGVRPDVMQLLRKCPVPVWLLRPRPTTAERILALIDPESNNPPHRGLNDLILKLAISMTRTKEAELHIATAWHFPGERQLRSGAFASIPEIEVDVLLRATEEDHRRQLDAFVLQHGGIEVGGRVHLVKGAPTEALPTLAEDLGITLIIMGTVARTGLSGLIMGNTAETILRSVDCSVLALKPAGFVSPVKVDEPD